MGWWIARVKINDWGWWLHLLLNILVTYMGEMQIASEFGNYKEAFLALLIIFERIILMIIHKWVVASRCYLDGKDYFCHNGHISHFISSIDVVRHWERGNLAINFQKWEWCFLCPLWIYHWSFEGLEWPSTCKLPWLFSHFEAIQLDKPQY